MTPHRRTPTLLVLLVVTELITLGACSPPVPGNLNVTLADGRRSAVLRPDEIDAAHAGTVYDAIERLRPSYLQSTRGIRALSERNVYVDDVLVGGTSLLRTMSPVSVREIRFLSAIEATARYGPNNPAGALLIVTGATRRLP